MNRTILEKKDNLINIYDISDSYLRLCAEGKAIYENKELISKYLEESLYLKIYLNLTKCLFTGKSISHYHTLCTDGVWIWSADLNHYTDNHHFLWPEAFIERMKQNHFLLNEISDEAHDNLDLFLLNDSNEEYRNIKNPDKSLFQYNYFKL